MLDYYVYFCMIKRTKPPTVTITRTIYSLLTKATATLVVLVAMLAVAPAARGQVNTDQTVTIGRNAMYFEDYVLAIQYFNRAISAKPYLAWPYFYRAVAKINLDDFDGAAADATAAIELNPFITDAYEVRGVALHNRGDARGAISDYRRALQQLPDNRQITYNMAMAMTEVGDYSEADSVFQRLLTRNPRFENGYLGRAQLRLQTGDTLAAEQDMHTALGINRQSFNAHAMLADLNLRRGTGSYDSVLVHLDEAIRLQPRTAGLYVNRSFVRYQQNDWYGAMADLDHALELEPANRLALFNRALLETEVRAYDNALRDFGVLLDNDPTDTRSHYNRALIHMDRGEYAKALADINSVIQALPDFATALRIRSQLYYRQGNMQRAAADSDRADAIAAQALRRRGKGAADGKNAKGNGAAGTGTEGDDLSEEDMVKREFASLLTSDDNTDMRQEFNSTEIRGRVQDRHIAIETEPMVQLTYYTSPTELKQDTYYIKEVDDLNGTRQLRNRIMVSTHVPTLSDEAMIARHFGNIDYYNSYLASHTPRAIDYFGRAMEFVTVRDYASAITDLNRVVSLTPDYAPAYMLRAQARARQLESGATATAPVQPSMTAQPGGDIRQPVSGGAAARDAMRHHDMDLIIEDLDRVIALSPRNAFAFYNKGNVLADRGDLAGAAEAYSAALALKPDFGEAYFNRGYVRLKQGDRQGGVNDLSKAGEHGIVAAYNVIKRITRKN